MESVNAREVAERAYLSDGMSPNDFEHFVADVFRRKGYHVTVTQQSGDFGADLLLESEVAKTAVQVKQFSEGNVGVKDITHLLGAKQYYQCDSAAILTTTGFTKAAREMASKTGVYLWDGSRLKEFAGAVGLAYRPEASSAVVLPQDPGDSGFGAVELDLPALHPRTEVWWRPINDGKFVPRPPSVWDSFWGSSTGTSCLAWLALLAVPLVYLVMLILGLSGVLWK